jgi:hypothetical protein
MDWIPILQTLATTALTAIILGIWKPWGKGYGEEMGKLRARDEKLDRILNEITAVTRAQKEIETQLAGDLWNRQMLWTEKKLTYAGLLTTVHQMLMYQGDMSACVAINSEIVDEEGRTKLNKRMSDAIIAFTSAEREMLRYTALSGIFASPQCHLYLSKALAVKRGDDWIEPHRLRELFLRLLAINERVTALAKQDLGVASETEGAGG